MNILFIITDQQRADHLGCAGNPDLKTPNLDKLANEGIRFTNAYCTSPMCMPNRATIFTGKYPSIHGVRCNGINLNKDIPTFTQTLMKNNYHTYSIGKIHLNYYGNPYSRRSYSNEALIPSIYSSKEKKRLFPIPYYGLEEVEMTIGHGDAVGGDYLDWVKEKSDDYYELIKKRSVKLFDKIMADSPIPEKIYPTTYITEKTISFLERFSEGQYREKNFFIHCSFPDPHHPVCPPGKYKTMYNPNEIEIPTNLNDISRLYNHKILSQFVNIYRPNWLRETSEEELRKFIAYTYGTISMIDNSIGKILTKLNSLNLQDDTIVIFTSDHGDFMGEHGILLKGPAHFNGTLKVPLILKIPGLKCKGKVSDSLTSSVDLPKSILEIVNIQEKEFPPGMQGLSILPCLKNSNYKIRDCVIVEEDEPSQKDSHNLPSIRLRTMITGDYRITLYENYEGFGDLYDLKKDPLEQINLWNQKEYVSIKNELLEKFAHELIKLQPHYPNKEARA